MKNLIIVLLFLTGFSACNKKDVKEEEEVEQAGAGHETGTTTVQLTKAQYETAGIEIGGTSVRNLSDVIAANGVIDIPPQNLVSISAPMGGFVRKTELLQGMNVKKGQVLALIENPDFIQMQQDFLETESKLEYAELEYKRQSELSRDNINAVKILQQAHSEVKVQKARRAGLRERLITAGINMKTLESGTIVNSTSIFSPISGSVTTVNVNLGKYVNPTDVMFEIVDTHHLHVELSVFEQDILKVKLGQVVRFTVGNNPGREHLAEVYLINQKINEDRTVRVHCHLLKDVAGFLPQNFVKAFIETGANPLEALPNEAIVEYEGKSYVFTQNQNGAQADLVFNMTEVTRGVSENGYSHIQWPAEFNRDHIRIVLKGAYSLLSKLKNAEEEE